MSEKPGPAIEIRGLHKIYGSGPSAYEALRGVDFSVERGELVMLSGPSGSGKTTLLSIMGCVLTASSGTVRLFDEDISTLTEAVMPRLRLSYIGFVFQAHNLIASLTARANVVVPLQLRGFPRAEARVEAERLLCEVGLSEKIESLPRDLSGGQRQRVAVARALAGSPPLLLCDEPTAALDAHNGLAITELLRRLAKDHGHTVVIVTHDNRIFHLGDRIVHIEDGLITDQGARSPGPSMTKRKLPYGPIAGIVLASGLVIVIIRSATSGPSSVPNAKDVKAAGRVELPQQGMDERTQVPTGNFVAGNGVIEPTDRETKVAGQLPGRIASIAVKEGDVIERGAVIADLEGNTERAALVSAQADADAARLELTRTLRGLRKEDVEAVVADTQSLRAKADLSKSSFERTQMLAGRGAATADELDRAARQAEADQRSLEAAEARRRAAVAGSRAEDIMVARAVLNSAMARVEQARANLDRLTLRAPITGEVLQVKFRAGEYYAPGGEPLVVMGDTRTLRVRVDVDERDVPKLTVGAHAFATLNAFPNRRFTGRVVEIGRRMGRKNIRSDDPTERIDTKILEVVFELDRKDGLVPGLRVLGYIESRNTN